MVVIPTMGRCQMLNLCCFFFHEEEESQQRKIIGILAFNAAKTMSRLLSLYHSLTDDEIHRLRRGIIKSKGVAYLNSKEEYFLLNLACAEHLDDLNLAAIAVSHLGRNCSDMRLSRFDTVFAGLKNGLVDLHKLQFDTRKIENVIENMEKLVSSTRSLHTAMESLVEMEALEKKMQRWGTMRANHGTKVKVECFNDKITFYRKKVQYYKQISLWNQTFDKVVGLMARIICIVYARICSVFGTLITGNKSNNNVKGFLRPKLKNGSCLLEHGELYKANIYLFDQNNEPMKKNQMLKSTKTGVIRFHNHNPSLPKVANFCGRDDVAKKNRVLNLAPLSTVGGAGLSMRYANVILFIDRCMHATAAIGNDARACLYEMLPGRLKVKVRRKLRGQWLEWEGNSIGRGVEGRSAMAKQWLSTVEEVMEWLLPMAHDTVRWQVERNVEKQKFETKLTVLLLQTLHYSDLEKVEEVIVEVLVGLSFLCWCQKQQQW
ncbi:hypothetical protein Lalb_Chr03g0042421 [Lupinus albus]|uniref:DUF668 domain-containing protein n=1 Tax=Lupinus albus TaxID=3870 RepID=A0A6A4QXY6_LUPAL|nr:hypothetical protein Lalb_Chr03g0042421 [Lupinus albus]